VASLAGRVQLTRPLAFSLVFDSESREEKTLLFARLIVLGIGIEGSEDFSEARPLRNMKIVANQHLV